MHYNQKPKPSALNSYSHQNFRLLVSSSFRLFGWRWPPKFAGLVVVIYYLLITTLIGPIPTEVKSVRAAAGMVVPEPTSEALFHQVWNRVDGPLVAGVTARSWLWGPGPFTARKEEYTETRPDGQREVMYFDKGRMEWTNPTSASQTVTYGLLVTEMISGHFQLGDNTFQSAPNGPAQVNVVGDSSGNWLTFTSLKPYASLQGDNRATDLTGQTVDRELTQYNGVQLTSDRAGQQVVAYYEPTLGHNIPKVFWDFFKQSGLVYSAASGNYSQAQLFNWLEAVGYPLTEPYWVRQKVAGLEKSILVQAFQRRTLTFTPDNPPAYQVEMGNVGRQYARWRYGQEFGPNQLWAAPSLDVAGLSEVVRGKAGLKRVAITLDAGSTAVAFPKQIAALNKYGIKITFFLTGRWVLEYPNYAQQIAAANMEIANHTYSHPDLTSLSSEQVKEEVNQGANAIERVTGQNPRPLFRFPYGARDGRVMQVINQLGYRSIFWTYDTLDSVGAPKSSQFLISRITGFSDKELDGAIILMHLGNFTSGEALDPILANLQSRSFKVVTISQLLS